MVRGNVYMYTIRGLKVYLGKISGRLGKLMPSLSLSQYMYQMYLLHFILSHRSVSAYIMHIIKVTSTVILVDYPLQKTNKGNRVILLVMHHCSEARCSACDIHLPT